MRPRLLGADGADATAKDRLLFTIYLVQKLFRLLQAQCFADIQIFLGTEQIAVLCLGLKQLVLRLKAIFVLFCDTVLFID